LRERVDDPSGARIGRVRGLFMFRASGRIPLTRLASLATLSLKGRG